MASLRHTSIVSFYAVCPAPPMIVMELCGRNSLDKLLQAARADPALAAELTWARRLGIVGGEG